MLFECDKLNPSSENHGSTTNIANLISLANKLTPVLKMYHLEQNLTVNCLCCWCTGLTKRRLLMQCITKVEVSTDKVQKAKSEYYWNYK